MTTALRFGVLGTGRITRRLVAELQQAEGIKVTAIASRDAARARWFADQFGIPGAVAGYQNLIAGDTVDAVYIALPPALHVESCLAAAEYGKHVLCEKPLVTCSRDAEKIAAACAAKKLQWLDATGWLHHSRTQRMREIIDSGALGKIKHVSASVSFFEPFQSGDHRLDASLGGGVLLDLGWYAFGMAIWAAGAAVDSVQAMAMMERGVINRVSAICQFPNNVSATISCGYDTATRKWMEIAGDHASLICDDFTRPWPDRDARFWVHDRAGAVTSEKFAGNQESNMIAAFLGAIEGHVDLSDNRQLAIYTQAALEKTASSLF